MRGIRASALAAVLCAAAALLGAAPARAAMIDDFETAEAARSWKFNVGAEFPGAAGSIATQPAQHGKALAITYDFSKGGRYVAAEHKLAQPVTARALRFSARASAAAVLGVRVQDSTGQWLQYNVERALAPVDAGEWFKTVVELGPTTVHWAGAADGVVHGAIRAVSLVVHFRDVRDQGVALFDQLETLQTIDVDLDPASVPLVPVAPAQQDLFEGLGVAVHAIADTVGLDAARSAGFTWARADLLWDHVEKSRGTYDWSRWDGLLDLLEARSMRPLFIVGYGNALYGGGPPTSSEASAAFAAFAKAAAEHFSGRGVHFEIWNEPDNFWTPVDPAAYARLARVAIDAVHAGDPSARVTTGGLAWFDFDFLNSMLIAGAATRANAVAIHPYRRTDAPETVADDYIRARALMERVGLEKLPLWDTEWGYSAIQFGTPSSAASRRRQALMGVRRLISARLVGFPLSTWYRARDDSGMAADDSHNHFGLLGADGSERPVLHAIRVLRAAAEGRTLVGVLDAAQPSANGIRLDGQDDTIWILWSATPDLAVNVRAPRPAEAHDLLGAPLPIGESYTLEEAKGPIYLRYPRVTSAVDAGSSGGGAPGVGLDGGVPEGGPAPAELQPAGLTGKCGCRAAGSRSTELPVAFAVALAAGLSWRRSASIRKRQ